jgi:starvation-inducible outer membrane lipoprotein
MKLLIAILAVSLTACVSVPVERKFPKSPEELMVACPDLQTIPAGTTQLSVVVEAVTANYGQYQLCQTKTSTWVEWYNEQKKIFDSVK